MSVFVGGSDGPTTHDLTNKSATWVEKISFRLQWVKSEDTHSSGRTVVYSDCSWIDLNWQRTFWLTMSSLEVGFDDDMVDGGGVDKQR